MQERIHRGMYRTIHQLILIRALTTLRPRDVVRPRRVRVRLLRQLRDVLLHLLVGVLADQEPVRRVRELAELVHLLHALLRVPEPELLLDLCDAAATREHLAERGCRGVLRVRGVRGDLLHRAPEVGDEAAEED